MKKGKEWGERTLLIRSPLFAERKKWNGKARHKHATQNT